MITNNLKQRVADAIIENGQHYASAAKQAIALDINQAQLSRIKKGDFDKVLSEDKWLNIAAKLQIKQSSEISWKTAKTPAFDFIYSQLQDCQQHSIAAVLCDDTDLGKTHTAKVYQREHPHSVYIDCSQVKSKQLFVRKIAQEFGMNHTGRFADVYTELVYNLRSLQRPLIILDEAGDLKADAFLEIKALWNATERSCGWYMMGADGLQAKLERARDAKKVGYAETLRRYGSRFQKVTPDGTEARESFRKHQFAQVARANGLGGKLQELYRKSGGSLERVRIEFEKGIRDGQQLKLTEV